VTGLGWGSMNTPAQTDPDGTRGVKGCVSEPTRAAAGGRRKPGSNFVVELHYGFGRNRPIDNAVASKQCITPRPQATRRQSPGAHDDPTQGVSGRDSPGTAAAAHATNLVTRQLHRQLGRRNRRVRQRPAVEASCESRYVAHQARGNGVAESRLTRTGDRIVVVVKKQRNFGPETGNSVSISAANKVRRGDVRHAVVVRTAKKWQRPDGSVVKFDDNACVLINKAGEPIGSRVSGVVAAELRQKQWSKILSLAPMHV
jgi:ribosomal protein L14